jgi:hypothetical protein
MKNFQKTISSTLQKSIILFLFATLTVCLGAAGSKVEKWRIFSIDLNGPSTGNPYDEVKLSAVFKNKSQEVKVAGFYNGDGKYVIRFSPDQTGTWTYTTSSNIPELSGKTGKLNCVKPSKGNHGPVKVADTWHFSYADGTPYFQVGTTCYQWTSQPKELQDQTIKTLSTAPFNKIRTCIFPKWYIYNRTEPAVVAYENITDTTYNLEKFNPAYWNNLEMRISQLDSLGIQADIVLFHPYDKWGFATMTMPQYEKYIRYAIARLAPYQNVWWSIANEYDFMTVPPRKNHSGNMQKEDWDHFFQLIQSEDPFHRFISIHNGTVWYDHTKSWVSHASIQNSKLEQGLSLREKYKKPVVYDECKYEGNIEAGWGQLTPQTMTQRFWIGAMNGCYVGHGECIKAPEDILWWGKGGVLRGESPKRIAFFRKVMEALPFNEMIPTHQDTSTYILAKPGKVYMVYAVKPGKVMLNLEGKGQYSVEAIDTWNMTTKKLANVTAGANIFDMPEKDYLLKITALLNSKK